jgi:hypothetical protein
MEAPAGGCHSIAQPVMSDLQIAMGHGDDDESAILHSAADAIDRVCVRLRLESVTAASARLLRDSESEAAGGC